MNNDDEYERSIKAIVESALLFPYEIRHYGAHKNLNYFADKTEQGLYQGTSIVEVISYEE